MHFCKAYLVWDFEVGASHGTVWVGLKGSQETVHQIKIKHIEFIEVTFIY